MPNEGLIFPKLNERQKDLYLKIIVNLNTYGYFDRSVGANGVAYASASQNPFKEKGIDCENCAFYYLEGESPRCELIEGPIEAEAICKYWIVSDEDIKEESKAAFRILNKKNKVFEASYEKNKAGL